jgi:hypothetical protein
MAGESGGVRHFTVWGRQTWPWEAETELFFAVSGLSSDHIGAAPSGVAFDLESDRSAREHL